MLHNNNKTVSVVSSCVFSVYFKMASVVFIIRVPYEENSKSLKSEEDNEPVSSEEGNKEEDIKRQTDDQNVKGVKFEISENKTDKVLDQDEAETYDDTGDTSSTSDQAINQTDDDDVEMFTGPLNLAEV
jgi:hypothetical protein